MTRNMDVLSPDQLIIEGQQALEAGHYPRARAIFTQIAEAAPAPDLHQVLASIAFESGDLEEARSQLHQALALDPDFVEALEGLAKIEFERGALQAALQHQEEVILRRPEDVPALVSGAVLNFELKRYERAQRLAGRVLEAEGENLEALLIAGRVHQALGQYAQGIELLNRAIALEPALLDAQLALGWCQLHLKQHEEARRSFEAVIDKTPKLPEAWRGLALLNQAAGEHLAALPAFRKCVELEPGSPLGHIELAWGYAEAQQLDKAVATAEGALAEFPEHPAVLGRLGVLFFRLKHYDRAELLLQKSLLRAPGDAEVQETLGYAYLVQKDYGQAIKNFRRVWQLKPLSWRTLTNLWIGYTLWAYHTIRNGRFGIQFSLKGGLKLSPGRSRTGQLLDLGQEHFKAGDYAKASMCFRKVRENDPNFEVAAIWLANCRLKQGYLAEAVEVCQRGLAKAPASAPLLALLGGLCLAQGKVKNAVRILKRALELDPDLSDAWATLGRAHQRERHYAEAYEAYQYALELNVEDPYIYRHMGDAALALEDRGQAAVAYKRAVEKNPRDLVATQRLIECCYTDKHYEEAILYARHALSIDANCYAAHVWLGRVYRSLKSNTAAVEAFEAAIAIRPTLGHLHRQLGAMHEQMTNWFEAIEAYQAALAIDAEDHEAERGLKRAKKMVGKR